MRYVTKQDDAAAGFTLLELLVVLAIIAFVAALTIPAITNPSDRFVLRKTIGEMTSALRLTRSAAIRANAEHVFIIDIHENSYRSITAKNRHFSSDVKVEFKVAEPERLSPARGGIRFFPDGSSTGGELTLSAHGERAKICIHWLTGRAVQTDNC